MRNKPFRFYFLIIGLLLLIAFPFLFFLHVLPADSPVFYLFLLILIFTLAAGYHDLKKIFERKTR